MQIQPGFLPQMGAMGSGGGPQLNPIQMILQLLETLLTQLRGGQGGGQCGCGAQGMLGNNMGMGNGILGNAGASASAGPGGAFASAGPSGAFAGGGQAGQANFGPLPQGVPVNLPGGGLNFQAGMNIDTDGSGCSHGDACHQNQTSLRTAGGGSLNADTCPYMVLPPQLAKQYGIKPGDLALVKYHGRVSPAIFGDVGPRNKLGEGSTRLAANLGINTDPNRGGVEGGVQYQVFPGSGRGVQWTAQNTTTDALMARIQNMQR